VSKNLTTETKQLAKAYSVEFKDCGSGHIQLKGHGVLVNYWPESKRKTLYSPTLERRETNCLPWDAVRLCLSGAKPGMKPSKPKKNRANFSLKPVHTNPAKLKHFYTGDTPPWEGEGFEFNSAGDRLRHEAWILEQNAIALRVQANEMDEAA